PTSSTLPLQLPPAMGLVASCVLSVTDGDRVCKFCYGEDDQNGRWLRPCMCSGSLKWVHLGCFDRWMEKAPAQQQVQCQTCRGFIWDVLTAGWRRLLRNNKCSARLAG
ncbi:zinc finger, C3HC4 type, partial [Oesophagostomum dentatum]